MPPPHSPRLTGPSLVPSVQAVPVPLAHWCRAYSNLSAWVNPCCVVMATRCRDSCCSFSQLHHVANPGKCSKHLCRNVVLAVQTCLHVVWLGTTVPKAGGRAHPPAAINSVHRPPLDPPPPTSHITAPYPCLHMAPRLARSFSKRISPLSMSSLISPFKEFAFFCAFAVF